VASSSSSPSSRLRFFSFLSFFFFSFLGFFSFLAFFSFAAFLPSLEDDDEEDSPPILAGAKRSPGESCVQVCVCRSCVYRRSLWSTGKGDCGGGCPISRTHSGRLEAAHCQRAGAACCDFGGRWATLMD